MTESSDDIIESRQAPLSHLQKKQDKSPLGTALGALDWRVYTTAAIVLLVLIGAFYWLPEPQIERSAQPATATSTRPDDSKPAAIDDNSSLAPFAAAQQTRDREKVKLALAEFVERQILLEDTMQVDQWGAGALEAAMN